MRKMQAAASGVPVQSVLAEKPKTLLKVPDRWEISRTLTNARCPKFAFDYCGNSKETGCRERDGPIVHQKHVQKLRALRVDR